MAELDAAEIARRVLDDDHGNPGLKEALQYLAVHPDKAEPILEELSRSRSVDVRAWASFAARHTLGHRAVPILLRLAKDRDPDVQADARQDLLEIDPALAQREFLPQYRRDLRAEGTDYDDEARALVAVWRVAQFCDLESLPHLRRLAETHRRAWMRSAATLAILMLEGRGAEIVERLRSHDHEWTRWLAAAASVIGTPEAIAALEHCSMHAPDEECRRHCAVRLQHLRPVRLFRD